jgi:hypothetical protein
MSDADPVGPAWLPGDVIADAREAALAAAEAQTPAEKPGDQPAVSANQLKKNYFQKMAQKQQIPLPDPEVRSPTPEELAAQSTEEAIAKVDMVAPAVADYLRNAYIKSPKTVEIIGKQMEGAPQPGGISEDQRVQWALSGTGDYWRKANSDYNALKVAPGAANAGDLFGKINQDLKACDSLQVQGGKPMDQDPKEKTENQPQDDESRQGQPGESGISRRDFFTSLGRWSKIVITAVLVGPSILSEEAGSMDMAVMKQPWNNTAVHTPPSPPKPSQPPPVVRPQPMPMPSCPGHPRAQFWDHVAIQPKPSCPGHPRSQFWDHVAIQPEPSCPGHPRSQFWDHTH